MKIYIDRQKKDLIIKELKKILPSASFIFNGNSLDVENFKYGYIYDKLPQIENIDGIKEVKLKNIELIPLAYKKNYYFKKPINTYKKFIIAGPCVIDNFDIFYQTALKLKELKVDGLRTPLFKPRSSPYGFQGFGIKGLEKLKIYKKEIKIPFVGEVLDTRDVEKVVDVFDVIQIGARNMKNYSLLKEVAKSRKVVLLKRQMKTTSKELLYSVEYLLKYGSKKIILCERGDEAGNLKPSINIDIIKEIKKEVKIPIIADISHSAKLRKKVLEFFKKSIKYADGIMVEVSIKPDLSLIDTKQIIDINDFIKIKKIIEKYNEKI